MVYKKTVNARYFENSFHWLGLPSGGHCCDFWLSHFGHFSGQGDFQMNYRTEFLFVYFVESGQTPLTVDGRGYLLESGDLFFFFPGQQKVLNESATAPLRNYYLNLSGTLAEPLLAELGISRENPYFKGGDFSKFTRWLDELKELFHERQGGYGAIAKAWEFMELLRLHLHARCSEVKEALALQAADLMHHYYHCHLEINEVAQKLGISRVTLYRQFKGHYRMSPQQYLMKIRMEKAVALLQTTNQAVAVIANQCGFENAAHFSRLFKARFNQTPNAFRAANSF